MASGPPIIANLARQLWLVFAAEYGTRLCIAMDRKSFAKHNIIDLTVVVLPMIPALRALRLARLGRIAVVGARVIDQSESVVKRSNAKHAVLLAGLIVLLAAVLAWSVETRTHSHPSTA